MGELDRRDFLRFVVGVTTVSTVAACAGDVPGRDPHDGAPQGAGDAAAGAPNADAGPPGTPGTPDAAIPCDAGFATVHDTHAQALYFDGSYGPLTGTITVAQILAGATVELDFWHGHGGQLHRFTLTGEHFAALLRGERVDLMTTVVEDHQHQLFVDPTDPGYAAGPDMLVPRPC